MSQKECRCVNISSVLTIDLFLDISIGFFIIIDMIVQIAEESTGSPPTDEFSIVEESSWIHNQLLTGSIPLFSQTGAGSPKEGQDLSINRDDLIRFLDLLHVQKLDVSIICSTLAYFSSSILTMLSFSTLCFRSHLLLCIGGRSA